MYGQDKFDLRFGDDGIHYRAFTSDLLDEEAIRNLADEASIRATEEGFLARDEVEGSLSSPTLTEKEKAIGKAANAIIEKETQRIVNDPSDPLIISYPATGGTLWD